MTVGNYIYYYNYLNNLKLFYDKNIYLLTITEKCKLSDEIKSISNLLMLV